MLKVIGKNINFSGLDKAFIEADTYWPTTLQQIIGGKHYKRSFEAFLTLYISLFQLYIKELFESKTVLKVALSEVISRYLEDKTRDFNQLLHDMTNLNLSEFIDEFNSKLTDQGKMLRNLMNLVKIMLLFIRAIGQGIWDLHLTSLEMFVKYFFAYDQINYARLTPVYLSELFALKSQDQQSWEFLELGNFSVNKSQGPFCALGIRSCPGEGK